MSDAGAPAPIRPSVFISYSSDDRTAARKLRDNLSAAGLEVWYDENELGGGDAWDQKIRRQIRDCDYFIPLISASTERRKEGYFRREWRLAAERTMDMADDVLFLVPVVIDGTSEIGARVPDKFVTVQWLRAPGGESTPALEALTKRLIAGEHVRPTTTRPPLLARPSTGSAAPQGAPPPAATPPPEGPPPMPPFPHHPPHSGHWPKYLAEVLWWFVTAVWTIFVRLPKFFRILIGIWLLITALGMCKSSTSTKPKSEPKPDAKTDAVAKSGTMPPEAAEALKALKETAEGIRSGKGGRRVDYGRIGQEIAKQFGVTSKTPLKGKALAIIPFDEDRKDRVAAQFTDTVFSESYGKLLIARPGAGGISPELPGDNNEASFAEVGRELGVELVLAGWQAKNAEGAAILEVRLVRAADASVAWSATYPVVAAEANAVAEKVAAAVLAALPPRKPAAPPTPATTPPVTPAPTTTPTPEK